MINKIINWIKRLFCKEESRTPLEKKTMKLKLVRWKGTEYSIGKLTINGESFCDTLEDVDRGLLQTTPLDEIKKIKVAGETAIPRGTYKIDMNTVSPKYSQAKYAKQYSFCEAKLPRLLDVPGFEGILIHIGNYAKDTDGCILVGYNTVKGAVMQSTDTFNKLYPILKEAADRGEEITITIE